MPHRNFRYRLFPSAAQAAQLEAMLGAFCDLYNAALHERIDCWRKTGRSLRYADQARELKAVRAVDEQLAGYSFTACQQLLRRVDKAFAAFFRRVKAGERPGFPRFKPKHRFDAIEFRVGDGLTVKKDGRIGLVGLPAPIKVRRHRPVPEGAKLGTAIVSRSAGQWYVSFLAELPEPQPVERPFAPVGIDVGITHLAALSDGTVIDAPRWAREAQAKQRRLQRALARKQRGSARRRKARQTYARFAARVAAQRRDFIHKLTTDLTRRFTHIAIEDLNLRALARGFLAKDVLNGAWGMLFAQLRYKAAWAGGEVQGQRPHGTSQDCSGCDEPVPKALSVRWHCCPHCGLSVDRDVNAARNVLVRASFMGPGKGLRAQSTPAGAGLAREAVGY